MKQRHLSILLAALASLSYTDAIITTRYGQYPDNCPSQCAQVGSNPVNWTSLHHVEDLSKCDERMLFTFNVQNMLTDPDTQVSLRACSYSRGSDGLSGTSTFQRREVVEDVATIERTIATSKNCGASTEKRQATPKVGSLVQATGNLADEVQDAAEILGAYLDAGAECGTTIMFAKSGEAVVGLYSGGQVQMQSATGIVGTFQAHAVNGSRVLEFCDSDTPAETFGMYAGAVSDLNEIQDAVRI